MLEQIRDLPFGPQGSPDEGGNPHGGEQMVDDEPPLAPLGWCVHDEGTADFATRRVIEARAHVARLEAQHRVRVGLAKSDLERAERFFVPQLEVWAAQNLPRNKKSVDVPSGRLSFRAVPGGIRVSDKDLALQWAKATLPEAVVQTVVERLDVERVKKAGEGIFSAMLAEAYESAPAEHLPAEAIEAAFLRAAAALPPGVENAPDRNSFSVNEPKGGAK